MLNSIFRAIAKMPLIGPHTHREKELLLAGAKPLGLIHPSEDPQKELDAAVSEGRLISKKILKPETRHFLFYTLPGYENLAIEEATLHTKKFHEPENFTPADDKRLSEINNTYQNDSKEPANPRTKQEIRRISFLAKFAKAARFSLPLYEALENKVNKSSAMLTALSLAEGAAPFTFHALDMRYPSNAQKLLDDGVQSGKFICFKKDILTHASLNFYGQCGQEQNIERLAQITLHNPTEDDQGLHWGDLYGYSDRDQQLYSDREQGQLNPIVQFLLESTNEWRRDIRHKLMLQEGPNWKRNF